MRARRRESATPIRGALAWILIAGITVGQATIASGESPVFGTVTGTYMDTWAADGILQTLTEEETGGKPSDRQSRVAHVWVFDVPPGNSVTLYVRAWHTPNTENDEIVFKWSPDGGAFYEVLTVTSTSDPGNYVTGALPAGTAGTIYIRARDTDRTPGNRSLDTLFVDHVFIESVTGGPPAAPTNLRTMDLSSTAILMSWDDNAVSEDGYRVERSLNGSDWSVAATLAADATRFEDGGLQAATTYHYVVYAYSSSGDSPPSNVATRSTRPLGAYGITFVDAAGGTNKDHDHHPQTGLPGMVYCSDGEAVLRVAEYDGQTWNVQVLGGGGSVLAFAYAPSGVASICHLLNEEFRFLERLGGTWVPHVIDTEVSAWDCPSLAYDISGEPLIAYRKLSGHKSERGLCLAGRASGVWVRELVDPGSSPRYASLAFDLQGNPAIAYSDDLDRKEFGLDTLKFAWWDGSAWNIEVIETGVSGYGVRASLSFDPVSGLPAICHNGHRVLVHDGSDWQLLPLLDGTDGQAVHDPTGILHVGYRRDAEIWLATWIGTWQQECVEPGRNSGWERISIDLDPLSQQPSLSYTGGMLGLRGVKFAQR